MDEIDWECAPIGTQRYISGNSKFSAKWLKIGRDDAYGWEVKGGSFWEKLSAEEWKDLHGEHGRTILKPPVSLDSVVMRREVKQMIEDSDYSILECQSEQLYELGYRKFSQ